MRIGIAAIVSASAIALAALGAAAPPAQQTSPGGNPFRGRERFVEKRCATCHSVWGHGGRLGPEITVVVAGKTFYELVGDFWNHTPQMIDQSAKLGYAWPTLDAGEMADILSYLYYLRLFDEPGNPERGGDTYGRLQCAACHELGGRGSDGGPALDRFGAYSSPVALAQAMWNAGPRMQEEQVRRRTPIPQFAGRDMADVQAYIRAQGQRHAAETQLQPLPSPDRGAVVFRAKRCGACHDPARRLAPDLQRSALSRTASEITGLLWNHSYAMGGRMRAEAVAFPRFAGTELSDLIAYLYFLGYAGERGDVRSGAAVFGAKGCASCHADGASGGGAPSLERFAGRAGAVALASAMWNHAPQMHSRIAERTAFWPKFEPGEMRNLAAYLGSPGPPAGSR